VGILNPGGMNQNASDMRQAIDGATIRVQMQLPNGTVLDLPGILRSNNSVDTTPAGLAENAVQHRRMMQGQWERMGHMSTPVLSHLPLNGSY